MNWRGDEILNISSEFLNSGGFRQSANIVVSPPVLSSSATDKSLQWGTSENLNNESKTNMKTAWLKNLADLNVCSKKGIAQQFDSVTGGSTVFMPYGGIHQRTPEQGLAIRLPLPDAYTNYGALMSVGYDPGLGIKSPFHAAMYAVIESVMKIVAMGGDYSKVRLSFQEYFEKLSSAESWGKPYAALMGAFLAQDELGIPAIGGKDSMSGTFNDINVPPSLISFAVTVTDMTRVISRAFKHTENNIYLIEVPVDDGGMPDFDDLKQNMRQIYNLNKIGCVKSASVVGAGGIAATISETAFGNDIGFTFNPEFNGDLFSPHYTSMILELNMHCRGDACKSLQAIKEDGSVVPFCEALCNKQTLLGTTSEKKVIKIKGIEISLDEARKAWEGTLSDVFPIRDTGMICAGQSEEIISDDTKPEYPKPDEKRVKPNEKQIKVLIPVFPGTTGEYELEKQFKNAGTQVNIIMFRTMTADDINDSFIKLTEAINETNILAIPAGMSAGSEPDGAGKLIAMILRHEPVKNAVNSLLSERNGLILGIGEGFKALLKTGLIQTGSIQDEETGDVILTTNPTNKHHCTLKTIKYERSDSPWLKNMSEQKETLPISGKETIIYMSDELFNEYTENGQIASYYTGQEKSPAAIEAMTSKSGQILGRTGLVENLSKGLYSNVFNAKESNMFKNAVCFGGKL